MSSIVVRLEEYDEGVLDSTCYIERVEGTWYVHADRVTKHTFSFPNQQLMLNFLQIYFDMSYSKYSSYVFVKDDTEDVYDLEGKYAFFGYDDLKLDNNLLRSYTDLCRSNVE